MRYEVMEFTDHYMYKLVDYIRMKFRIGNDNVAFNLSRDMKIVIDNKDVSPDEIKEIVQYMIDVLKKVFGEENVYVNDEILQLPIKLKDGSPAEVVICKDKYNWI